ncbi:ParB N-terminal domain-containing protein [Streptomyces specialis]|uniref:ParB N-terminal domain-containing protein n=1 Tax=Streptomyces specialis TaxID=498367 RepID=UPI00073F5AAB|nr:ParB N-terminal domain-containing protein [Streptomyces specialis]
MTGGPPEPASVPTPPGQGSGSTAGDREFFQFLTFRWDVTRAKEIAAGITPVRLNPEPFYGLLSAIEINEQHAARVDITRPLLAVKIRDFDGAALIIDGWHRVARAQRDGITDLPVIVLDEAQEWEARVFGGTKTSSRKPNR